MAIKTLVAQFGYKADTAVSGQIAVNLVTKRLQEMSNLPAIKMYKLILLDYAMPEMDGLETCVMIRERIQ